MNQRVLTKLIRASAEVNRSAIVEWLSQPNEVIMKSERFDELINQCCMHFYKKTAGETSDDNLSFIRRSANELLRNKASKEAMRKRLLSNDYRYEEDDIDISQQMYGVQVRFYLHHNHFQNGMNDNHIMIVDQNVMNPPVPIASYEGLAMNHMNGMINISPINGIPINTYDGMPPMQQLGQNQNASNVSMSIPVNNMSVNVNMNGINSINLNALPTMSVNPMNSLQLPVGIQPMNLGVIDNHRPFNGTMNSNIDIPITHSVSIVYCYDLQEDADNHASGPQQITFCDIFSLFE